MIVFTILLTLISIYQLYNMAKQQLFKEIAVFLGIIMVAFITGYIYFSDPIVNKSIVKVIFDILKIK